MNGKLRIKQIPVLFCKYFRNESWDPHEILLGGQMLSCELKFQISWRFLNKCARTSYNRARVHFIVSTCTYARIFMKFKTEAHKIVLDHHKKFHEDPNFHCGDTCKTILVSFNRWFPMYFSYFPNNAPLKPSEMDNCWIIIKFKLKCSVAARISWVGRLFQE